MSVYFKEVLLIVDKEYVVNFVVIVFVKGKELVWVLVVFCYVMMVLCYILWSIFCKLFI